ncbi:Ankyrin repeat-containing domain protein [Elaphomyces granulatus]
MSKTENSTSSDHRVPTISGYTARRLSHSTSNGLLPLWREDECPVTDVLTDYDVIVVHGLLGERNLPWKNRGSGDSSWMSRRCWEGKRVFSFGYDMHRILVGYQTREAIRKQAFRLLNDLKVYRENDTKRRPIAFLAHDIGGIIVKDALVAAGLNATKYGDIFDYSRFLIFYGYPHRSNGIIDMENRIARFLFRYFEDSKLGNSVTVASTKSLAAAVTEINGLFLEAKFVLRTHVISVYADVNQERIDMDSVFDVFCGTLGLPFERQIMCSCDDGAKIFQNPQKMQAQLTPDARTLGFERIFLSLAPPIFTFSTAHSPDHPFSWITTTKEYESWLGSSDPGLLYVYGSHGTQDASEYIFYSLDEGCQNSEQNDIVLYFTFNRNDIRYRRVGDMLRIFLSQMINHYPTLAEFVRIQFEHLRQDRAYNEFDFLSWFEYFRARGQIDDVTCVINYFDDCDGPSRSAFLKLFSHIAKVQERSPLRIVVTTHQLGGLAGELSDWPVLDLDNAKPDRAGTLLEDSKQDTESYSSHLPRHSIGKDLVEKQIAEIDEADPGVRQVILEQHRMRDESVFDTLLQFGSSSVANISLKSILDRVLQSAPDSDLAWNILLWSSYAVRSLTVWELSTAVFLGSREDNGLKADVSADFTEGIVDKINTWFAGVLKVVDNEVRIQDVEARQPLRELITDKFKFESPDKRMALTCLNFLQRDSAKKMMAAIYSLPYTPIDNDTVSMDVPTFPDRTNFATYAIRQWPKHFARIPRDLKSPDLLNDFVESGSVRDYARADWVLAEPISRSLRFQLSYPLFAARGLADDAEKWCNGDEDISRGLYESALWGYRDTARSLLVRIDHSVEALQEALITASANGCEETLMDIINHVGVKHENFPWPKPLLHRVVWLGLHKVTSTLLDAGVPVDGSDNRTQRATPIHSAARHGHIEIAKLLLDKRASPMSRGPWGQTPAHIASTSGHADIIRLLKESGADLNARDENNFTPLYEACLWGNFETVKVLLEQGADARLGTSIDQDSPGWTPLIVAAEEGHVRCVEILLKAEADPNLRGPHGTPLHYALGSGHENTCVNICRLLLDNGADPNHSALSPPILAQIFLTLKKEEVRFQLLKLFTKHGACVNYIDSAEMPPLMHAAQLGDVACVEHLLDCGADVSLIDNDGRTAFALAVDKGSVEVVRLLIKAEERHGNDRNGQAPLFRALNNEAMVRFLLEHEADPNVRDKNELTPLMHAAERDLPGAVKLLLRYGAEVDLEIGHSTGNPASGQTALTYAAISGAAEVTCLLVEAGAKVNHRHYDESRAVHHAVGGSSMRTLLEFRPDINLPDNDSNTPLHFVRSSTPLEHVQLLVHAGANLDLQNKEGCTPLSIALYNDNDAVASYMIERQANVNIASPVYGAPLHLACQRSTIDMVRRLVKAGADVDLAVSGVQGTPLQAAVLRQESCFGETNDIISYLTEEAGVDINRTGGRHGSALAVAAWRSSSAIVSFLLEKGAAPELADGMGRLPLHLAMLSGLSHVKLILEAAGVHLRARDKTGRSALHWAAQGGNADILGYVIGLLNNDESFGVDDKDDDGWTALCWASRGCGTKPRPARLTAQIEVIKLLLEHGADVNVKARFSTKELWTPLRIAMYSCATDDVLELLDPEGGRMTGFGRAETTAFLHSGYFCTFCLGEIRGIRYQCKDCLNFYFCYKCNNSRSRLHTEGHLFDEIGPELMFASDSSETSSDSEEDL